MGDSSGRIAIIGAGRIGSLCAWSMAMRGICSQIVLVDTDQPKLNAQATDLCDASMEFSHSVKIFSGGYADCADADAALICVGAGPQGISPRGETLSQTAAALNGVAENLTHSGFSGVSVLACHPNDLMARYFQQVSGYPAQRLSARKPLCIPFVCGGFWRNAFRWTRVRLRHMPLGKPGKVRRWHGAPPPWTANPCWI